MDAARGGAVLGQGKHGKTYDAVSDDPDSLLSELSEPGLRAKTWVAYVDGKASARGVKCDERKKVAVMEALQRAQKFVAKTFLGASNRTADESFELEMEMRRRVIEAFGGARPAKEYTTVASGMPVRGVGELVGLRVRAGGRGGRDALFMVSSKCQVPLDRYNFSNAADLVEMAGDILDAFAVIHRGGLIHADVKLDNMVFCRDGPGRRFKLIDWGASMHADALVRQYLDGGEPKNTASPMAWYAWGLGRHMTINAFMLIHARHYIRTFMSSMGFVQFCTDAMVSFSAAARRMEHDSGMDERRVAREMLNQHVRSFDLYSFGIALAHLAYSSPAASRSPRTRRLLLSVARALTHYNDDNFVGNDAAAAAHMLRSPLK